MKKATLGVLALAGTLFVQLAGAGTSTATEQRVNTKPPASKIVTRGQGMTAEFERTDGCIWTRVSVFGSVFTVKGSTTPATLGFVSVTQENTCTLTTLINGFGEATSSLNLAVPNGLSKGRLQMSMEFTNFADPDNPAVSPMTADLSFRATAQATKTSAKSESRSESIRSVSSQHTKRRPASVAGTVTLGAENILPPANSSFSATIASVVSIEKMTVRPVK